MIEVRGLCKQYGKTTALQDVSFDVKKGEILGLLGRNGAGKSTTMNIVTGYLSSDAGDVIVDGFDIFEQPLQAKKRIGYLPEQPPLYHEMTVKDYLQFVCKLKDVPGEEIPRQLDRILEQIGIGQVQGRLIGNLSKGYKQRVGLAQALCGNPQVVILDEPTVGLDPSQVIEVRNAIRNLGEEHIVILSSHILKEISNICNKVVILHKGRVKANASMDELLNSLEGQRTCMVRVSGNVEEFGWQLGEIGGVQSVQNKGEAEAGHYDFEVIHANDADVRGAIFEAAVKTGCVMVALQSKERTLEEVFSGVTAEE